MFARGQLDAGTSLLLRTPRAARLHRATCSTSAAAPARSRSTMARRSPDATVWAIDVNERALDLCARNAERNGSRTSGCVHPTRSRPTAVRHDLVEPADPHRQSSDSTSCCCAGSAGLHPTGSCGARRPEAPRRRFAPALADRTGPADRTASPRRPATACSACPPPTTDSTARPTDCRMTGGTSGSVAVHRARQVFRRGRVDFDADLGAGRARRGVQPRPEIHPVGGAHEVVLGAAADVEAGRRERLDELVAPAPDTRARAPNGGNDSICRRTRSPSVTIGRIAGDRGSEHLVVGRERLDQHLGRDAPGASDERQRVLGGAEAGASISESNSRNATTSASLTRCSTASVPTWMSAARQQFVRRSGDGHHRAIRRAFEFLAEPRHARTQVGEGRPATLPGTPAGARCRTGDSAGGRRRRDRPRRRIARTAAAPGSCGRPAPGPGP